MLPVSQRPRPSPPCSQAATPRIQEPSQMKNRMQIGTGWIFSVLIQTGPSPETSSKLVERDRLVRTELSCLIQLGFENSGHDFPLSIKKPPCSEQRNLLKIQNLTCMIHIPEQFWPMNWHQNGISWCRMAQRLFLEWWIWSVFPWLHYGLTLLRLKSQLRAWTSFKEMAYYPHDRRHVMNVFNCVGCRQPSWNGDTKGMEHIRKNSLFKEI